MAKKVEKQDVYPQFKDSADKIFGLKQKIIAIEAQQGLIKSVVVEKLGDQVNAEKGVDIDIGNGSAISIRPPMRCQYFDRNVFLNYLEIQGLLDKAKEQEIVKVSKKRSIVVRTLSDVKQKILDEQSALNTAQLETPLPLLCGSYVKLSQKRHEAEDELDKTAQELIADIISKQGESAVANDKIVSPSAGSISFKVYDDYDIDIEKARILVPEKDKDVLKSGVRVYREPMVTICDIEDLRKYHGQDEEPEEPDFSR